jgi:ribonuclease Z
MKLVFLGTGAGMPSKARNVTSIALTLYDERGTMWLFDCGEATQHRILHTSLKLGKLEYIFITHMHGDHIFGLPGLLSSRSHQGGDTPLTIFGPKGIRQYVETSLKTSGTALTYELRIEEIEPGEILHDETFAIEAAHLEHRIECFGYRIREKEQPGRLDSDRLKQLGIPAGPHLALLKKGEDVVLADGTTLYSADFVGPTRPGRIVTILGDTCYCDTSIELARHADVVVHEATFASDRSENACQYGHSTAEEAAKVAKQAEAKALILTHISSRYQEEVSSRLLSEAQAVFKASSIAQDFMEFDIPKHSEK